MSKLIEYMKLVGRCSGKDLYSTGLDLRELEDLVKVGLVRATCSDYGIRYYQYLAVKESILGEWNSVPEICNKLGLGFSVVRAELNRLVDLGEVIRAGDKYQTPLVSHRKGFTIIWQPKSGTQGSYVETLNKDPQTTTGNV